MKKEFAQTVAQRMALAAGTMIAVSWLVYFVFAPTIGFDWLESWHDEQRALQVVLLLATTLGYLWLSLVTPVVRGTPLLWAIFALGTLSALVAKFPIHAAAEVALMIQLFLLGAFAATLARRHPREASLSLLCAAWLIGAVYVVGVASNCVGVIVEQRKVDMEVFILGYANPRFVSALHALILPLIAWLAIERSVRPSLRYTSWGIATLLWVINLAIGTRAIWAAFLAAGIVLWGLGGEASRRAVKALIVSAAAGTLIYLVILVLAPAIVQVPGSLQSRMGDLGTSSARIDLWLVALDSIYSHPWLGIGPMHFASLHEIAGAHPHNWIFHVASEWGLPALAILLIVVYRWLQNLRSAVVACSVDNGDDALPAIGLSMLVAITYGLVDGNWVMPVSQSFAVILAGASVGLFSARKLLPARTKFELPGVATVVVFLATAAILGWYTHKSAGLQAQIEREYTIGTHGQVFAPRFWQQGYISEESAE